MFAYRIGVYSYWAVDGWVSSFGGHWRGWHFLSAGIARVHGYCPIAGSGFGGGDEWFGLAFVEVVGDLRRHKLAADARVAFGADRGLHGLKVVEVFQLVYLVRSAEDALRTVGAI